MTLDINIGDGADALTINQLTDALSGTYWVDGWEASLGTGDLEIDISAGEGSVDGSSVSTGSTQTVDLVGDVDADDPRKAVIYVDGEGDVDYGVGDAVAADPEGEIRFRTWDPAPPASVDGVVIAEVWLAAAASELVKDDLRSRLVTNEAAEDAISDYTQLENTPTETGVLKSSFGDKLASPDEISDLNAGPTLASNQIADLEEGFYNDIFVEIEVDDGPVAIEDIRLRLDGDQHTFILEQNDGEYLVIEDGINQFDFNFESEQPADEIQFRYNGLSNFIPADDNNSNWVVTLQEVNLNQLGVAPHRHPIED